MVQKNDSSKTLEEIIHQISYYPKKRLEIFRGLKPNQKRDVVLNLGKKPLEDIFLKLNDSEVIDVLEQLDFDEATDVLQVISKRKRARIMEKLSEEMKKEISMLLQFDPDTAAGLMSVDYIQVEAEDNVSLVSRQIKVHEKRTGKPPVILAMDKGRVIGYLPAYILGIARSQEKIRKYLRKIKIVRYNAGIDEIVEIFRQHPHTKIIVEGDSGEVVGVLYADDVLNKLYLKKTSSLYDFAGVNKEESVYDPARRKVRFRYRWLILNLATAFLAAFTVGLFDKTIARYVLLAVYMPIVAGMGGNAATQTLAVLVRGLALRQVNYRTIWRTLRNELGAGFINGLINGFIVASIVFIKDNDFRIALILGAAMIINLLVAAFFGTIVPLIMKRLGKDPASSATIFITTATDVFGFFAFLGLATLFLR